MPYIEGGYTPSNFAAFKKRQPSLSGDALAAKLDAWASYGTIEPDAAEAIKSICCSGKSIQDNKKWKNTYFVIIGAYSQMGPYETLLMLGANVIAIDIPKSLGRPTRADKSKNSAVEAWKTLVAIAEKHPGKLWVPIATSDSATEIAEASVENFGANLAGTPRAIAEALSNLHTSLPGKPTFVIGNYTYLNGDLHVKLSLASDAIIAKMTEVHPSTGCAFLCTPTDLHCIPDAARDAAKRNGAGLFATPYALLCKVLSMGKFLQSNVNPKVGQHAFVDGISVAQGPNYALAKRLQHWRAQIMAYNGKIVSSNIAPSTATVSVLQNKTFGWAYGGMPFFKPYVARCLVVSCFVPWLSRGAASSTLI